MNYQTIVYEEQEQTGVITLNRPEKANALSREMIAELTDCFRRAGEGRTARVLVVRGAGRHFCAGHDLAELRGRPAEAGLTFEECSRLMMLLHQVPQPVIAQVHGTATAAGCQLVAACDLAVAEEGARFATPGVKIGLFCSTPMVPLSRAVGRKPALEMLFTGDFVSADQARAIGLVNRVVPAARLEEETRELARRVAASSLIVLELGKQAFYTQARLTGEAAYQYATAVMTRNAGMEVAAEGIDAFLEKRAPVWPD
ncbi:MAG: enoyl-CoA hydratase [Actinomycetota bacterium]